MIPLTITYNLLRDKFGVFFRSALGRSGTLSVSWVVAERREGKREARRREGGLGGRETRRGGGDN